MTIASVKNYAIIGLLLTVASLSILNRCSKADLEAAESSLAAEQKLNRQNAIEFDNLKAIMEKHNAATTALAVERTAIAVKYEQADRRLKELSDANKNYLDSPVPRDIICLLDDACPAKK